MCTAPLYAVKFELKNLKDEREHACTAVLLVSDLFLFFCYYICMYNTPLLCSEIRPFYKESFCLLIGSCTTE